ncbi:alpha/beta fold hydrolase [Shimia sediminis]|uniref:alpha/beta fold hydrolase n=1 Tax=Shimia sediminis TaxID=2497945 RepID=UPI000F8C4DD4|nr:alpha/beta hydrolase [Shimia sediminis]
MSFQTHTPLSVEYLESEGDGPAVVLLHGIGSNAAAFGAVMRLLPQSWRVIAWNAPGYGASDSLQQDWPTAEDYADALKGFLDRLDLASPFLAGHSLGTLIGAAFAKKYPDRLAKLLLASPALGYGVEPGGSMDQATQARINDLSNLGADAFAHSRAARLVYDAANNPDVVELVQGGMSKVHLRGYSQAAKMLSSGRLLDDAASITVPTNVLVGSGDVVTPPSSALKTHAALNPDIRGSLTQLPVTGHAIHQQNPAAFAAALQTLAEPGSA